MFSYLFNDEFLLDDLCSMHAAHITKRPFNLFTHSEKIIARDMCKKCWNDTLSLNPQKFICENIGNLTEWKLHTGDKMVVAWRIDAEINFSLLDKVYVSLEGCHQHFTSSPQTK